MRQLTRLAAEQALASAELFQTFGQVICCVDPRCTPVYGPTPFKHHGVLGAHIGDRNGVAITNRLEHDARRAVKLGKTQLVIVKFHTDCAYLRKYGLTEDRVWADARAWCWRLPNTTVVRCTRDTATGALTFHGPRHTVEVAKFLSGGNHSVSDLQVRNVLSLAGFDDSAVANDLARFIQGNLAYLRQSLHPLPIPHGVVVGTGIARSASHFSVSNRFEPNLTEALGIAVSKIREQGRESPEVAVVVTRNPRRHDKQGDCVVALRFLKASVQTALNELGLYRKLPLYTLFADKGTGEVLPVAV